MSACVYHPGYRACQSCGHPMQLGQVRGCIALRRTLAPVDEHPARVTALREARALIAKHAMSTYRGGLIERSDGITEVLVDFDRAFPEALER